MVVGVVTDTDDTPVWFGTTKLHRKQSCAHTPWAQQMTLKQARNLGLAEQWCLRCG